MVARNWKNERPVTQDFYFTCLIVVDSKSKIAHLWTSRFIRGKEQRRSRSRRDLYASYQIISEAFEIHLCNETLSEVWSYWFYLRTYNSDLFRRIVSFASTIRTRFSAIVSWICLFISCADLIPAFSIPVFHYSIGWFIRSLLAVSF